MWEYLGDSTELSAHADTGLARFGRGMKGRRADHGRATATADGLDPSAVAGRWRSYFAKCAPQAWHS